MLTDREIIIHGIFTWNVAKLILEYDRINSKKKSPFKEELSLHLFKNSKRYFKFNLDVPLIDKTSILNQCKMDNLSDVELHLVDHCVNKRKYNSIMKEIIICQEDVLYVYDMRGADIVTDISITGAISAQIKLGDITIDLRIKDGIIEMTDFIPICFVRHARLYITRSANSKVIVKIKNIYLDNNRINMLLGMSVVQIENNYILFCPTFGEVVYMHFY